MRVWEKNGVNSCLLACLGGCPCKIALFNRDLNASRHRTTKKITYLRSDETVIVAFNYQYNSFKYVHRMDTGRICFLFDLSPTHKLVTPITVTVSTDLFLLRPRVLIILSSASWHWQSALFWSYCCFVCNNYWRQRRRHVH